MVLRSGFSMCLLVGTVGAQGDDAVGLVQRNLGSSVDKDDPVSNAIISSSLVRGTNATGAGLDLSSLNGSNTSNGSEFDIVKTYQLRISETWGATYQCISELEFYDELLNPIDVEYMDQSSCYGCATACGTCEAAYGNPRVQFDGWPHPEIFNEVHSQETVVHPEKWSCSASGSFFQGRGEQVITFLLKERPARYILRRLAVGDFVAKDWTLEEQQPDGTWGIVSLVANASKAAVQTVDVQTQGIMIPPPVFPEAWKTCGGGLAEEVINLTTDEFSPVLTYQYIPVSNLVLSNNGHGLQVDGRLGSMQLDDGIYDALQFHFHFPSRHRMNGGELAAGEMHILHKKRWVIGEPPKLGVVTILLDLPMEGSEPTLDEMFFRNIGMENIPNESSPRPIRNYVDLNSLARVLSSQYVQIPCTDELHWIAMSESAHVSGYIVKLMRESFCSTCEIEPNMDIDGSESGTGIAYDNKGERELRWFDNRPLPVDAQHIAMKGGGEFQAFNVGQQ